MARCYVLTVFMLIGVCRALNWSKKLESDNVQVCSGQNIQLLWNFTLDEGERLKGMQWDCQPEGQEKEVMATYVGNHFVPKSGFSGRLDHLQDGGIELSCATILESGNYSIAVSTENMFNVVAVHRKTVDVAVVDIPKSVIGEVGVTKDPKAVQDLTTGQWHIQLSFGNFSDRGHPPIDVVWQTPSGQKLKSSSFEDGMFRLLVPNPVEGGNYSCAMDTTQKAVQCLEDKSPLLNSASVHVEMNDARFILLEARQQELMEMLNSDSLRFSLQLDLNQNRTDVLEGRLDKVKYDSTPVSFHALLQSDTTLSSNSVLKLSNVVNNQGNGYDKSTGRFTAPVNGTYFFIGSTGFSSNVGGGSLKLMKESSLMARTVSLSGYEQRYISGAGSCHATMHLAVGERVWLQSEGSRRFTAYATFFSGFKI